MTDEKPTCQECEDELNPLGSFWACGHAACDRFAVPCTEVLDGKGYTQSEYDEEAAARGERQAVSDMEQGYDTGWQFQQLREIL